MPTFDLVISTSTAHQLVAVALTGSNKLLVKRQRHWRRGQERTLLADIDSALTEAGGAIADLGRLVCDVGPGSFTGLRFGLSTARALAWALDVPTVGVGSLAAMQLQAVYAGHADGPEAVCAVLPSRRGVVYARYQMNGKMEQKEVAIDELVTTLFARSARSVIAPAATLANLGINTQHSVIGRASVTAEHPSLAALWRAAAGRTAEPGGPLPEYVALSQPERLAAKV